MRPEFSSSRHATTARSGLLNLRRLHSLCWVLGDPLILQTKTEERPKPLKVLGGVVGTISPRGTELPHFFDPHLL